LSGETEASSAGTQLSRGIAGWAHRNDEQQGWCASHTARNSQHRIDRPLCLENPRPQGGIFPLTPLSDPHLHAEPTHASQQLIQDIQPLKQELLEASQALKEASIGLGATPVQFRTAMERELSLFGTASASSWNENNKQFFADLNISLLAHMDRIQIASVAADGKLSAAAENLSAVAINASDILHNALRTFLSTAFAETRDQVQDINTLIREESPKALHDVRGVFAEAAEMISSAERLTQNWRSAEERSAQVGRDWAAASQNLQALGAELSRITDRLRSIEISKLDQPTVKVPKRRKRFLGLFSV